MVSCRCTSRITREFRAPSSWAILRVRMASSMRWRSTGCSAVNMKNIQKMSLIVMRLSCRSAKMLQRCHSSASPRIKSENAFVGLIDAITPLGPEQQRSDQQSGHEPTDMRPPGDAAFRGLQQRHCPLEYLKQKPEPDEHDGMDLEEQRQKQDRHHNDHARERKQAHGAAQNAGDGSGCAQGGHLRSGI